jgi:ribonuclease VapC
MIIDTSALIAIIACEDDASAFAEAIEKATICRLSAANWVEAGIILDRRADGVPGREFDLLVQRAQIRVEPITEDQARIARQAYLIYGKGRHPAALNFADCFSYALSKVFGEPLLFKGSDFSRTDVMSQL